MKRQRLLFTTLFTTLFTALFTALFTLLLVLSAVILHVRSSYAAGRVGNGTPVSCSENALLTAVSGSGIITFNYCARSVKFLSKNRLFPCC